MGASRLLAAVLALAAPWGAYGEESIFLSRSFPGNTPAYFEVAIDAGGRAEYREEPGEPDPVTFELSAAEREQLFGWVRALDFSQPLSVQLKNVAFIGDKTIRYTPADGAAEEAKFVHTASPEAKEIAAWAAKASETARHLITLETALQFDRLGVNHALLAFHSAYGRGRIVAPRQFLPVLRKIADQGKIVHLARARAAGLIEEIERSPE
jgi:hypothetical protein